ncbi:MAG: hypothetical protein GH154_03595 [Firmicutes bacterium]|nr:hypothetical protein [Bacillota bacterium]
MRKITSLFIACTLVLSLFSLGKAKELHYPKEIPPLIYEIYDLVIRDNPLKFIPDDPNDYWQSPAETEARGGGDSEDLAIWVYKKLWDKYYQVNFMTCRIQVWGRDDFHMWVRFNTHEVLGGTFDVWDIDLTTRDKIFPGRIVYEPTPEYKAKLKAALERDK